MCISHLSPRKHTHFIQKLVSFSIQSTTLHRCFSDPVDGGIQWINDQTENRIICLVKYLNMLCRCRSFAYLISRNKSFAVSLFHSQSHRFTIKQHNDILGLSCSSSTDTLPANQTPQIQHSWIMELSWHETGTPSSTQLTWPELLVQYIVPLYQSMSVQTCTSHIHIHVHIFNQKYYYMQHIQHLHYIMSSHSYLSHLWY